MNPERRAAVLYDTAGNPVEVELTSDGRATLVMDPSTRELLTLAVELLTEIRDLVTQIGG